MTVYSLEEQLREITMEQAAEQSACSVFVVTEAESEQVLKRLHIEYEGEITLQDIFICKIDSYAECLSGSFIMPRILDVDGQKHKMQLLVNDKYIILIENNGYALRTVNAICQKGTKQEGSKARFLYAFLSQMISKDLRLLEQYENKLIRMEETLNHDEEEMPREMLTIRKNLLSLKCYYEQLFDMGEELEDNEIGIFKKKELLLFGAFCGRAERLKNRAMHLLDYSQQIKEGFREKDDRRQSENMRFLTVMSTIFYPLTLITSWYGMNFQNMPELSHGYPVVIGVSVCVVLFCIWLFRKKKIISG